MYIFYKKMLQNISIFLLMFIGIKNFIISLPLKYSPSFRGFYSHIDMNDTMFFQGRLSFIVSLIMILLAYNLYRRVRSAWAAEIIVLIISIILQFKYFHAFALHMIIMESFVLLILLFSADDFSRPLQKQSLKKASLYILLSFLLLILNASLGIYIFSSDPQNTLSSSFIQSINLMFFIDKSVLTGSSKILNLYADSLITLYWVSIFSAIILLLEPITYRYFKNKSDIERVRSLVLRYGQNPMSYLAVEDDKSYFFSEDNSAVCAYTIVGNVMVICGDIICDKEKSPLFLNELIVFSKKNHCDIVFVNITDYFSPLYLKNGFGILKYGEDACFKLDEYNLIGGKAAKVRAAINHATKAGITVSEYRPDQYQDKKIERDIQHISGEWLKNKKMPEMKFMLGGINLDSPKDRRYFYARNAQGEMLGFVVFLPYQNKKAYLADVTRRKNDAPQGVIEKIIYEAFMAMKDEGVIYANMGLSPLFNVSDGDGSNLSEKISSYIYETLNSTYNFKSLHHSKEKYAPTSWQPRYIAYSPKPMTLKYAYAVVRSQNQIGVKKLIFLKTKAIYKNFR